MYKTETIIIEVIIIFIIGIIIYKNKSWKSEFFGNTDIGAACLDECKPGYTNTGLFCTSDCSKYPDSTDVGCCCVDNIHCNARWDFWNTCTGGTWHAKDTYSQISTKNSYGRGAGKTPISVRAKSRKVPFSTQHN